MSLNSPLTRRTVLSYGAFDLSHPAQVQHLLALRALGDELIYGCTTDAFAARYGMVACSSYRQRRAVLERCRYVSRVIEQQTLRQIRTDIVNYNVSIFAMGDDWTGEFDDLEDIAQVVYLPRASGAHLSDRIAPDLQAVG